MALSSERETEEELKEHRERAVALRYQKQGYLIKGGTRLCVFSHRLGSLWTLSSSALSEQRNSGLVEWVVGHDLVYVGESGPSAARPRMRDDSVCSADRVDGARAVEAHSHTLAEANERRLPGCGALAFHSRLSRVS